MEQIERPGEDLTAERGTGVGTLSHVVYALVLIGWGVLGLVKGDFAPGWQPVPESVPMRQELAYLCGVICVGAGVGLLWRTASVVAARMFFIWLLLWLFVLRLPWMVVAFGVDHWWSASSSAIIAASAWVVYLSLANDWDRRQLGFLVNEKGSLMARLFFGLGLIPIGLAHFLYLEATAPLVPGWLVWPVFWAYFTGATFIAAGIAVISGVFARLAAALVTLQIGLLTLLVWVPIVFTGEPSALQWGEVVVSIVLTACSWVVAGSYRGTPWLGINFGNLRKLA